MIWPHSLLLAASWWYVRAFDQTRNDFRNFALHRFQSVTRSKTELKRPTATDLDWDTEIDVEIAPAANLDAELQAIVALDYNMQSPDAGWRWSARMRRALVGYFAIEHRLDLVDNPQPGRLVCVNRRDIESLLFRTETAPS